MTDEKLFHLKFTEGKISPELVSAKELSSLLASVDTLIEETVLQEFPRVGYDDYSLSLVRIERGSLELVFNPGWDDPLNEIFSRITEALNNLDFSYFSSKALDALRSLLGFVRKHEVHAEFRFGDKAEMVSAVITPEMVIEPFPKYTGETVLYGVVQRVGGKSPTLNIDLTDGINFTCDISDQDTARELASFLYMDVGLKGLAQWSARDHSLQAFKITEVLRYQGGSYVEAFKSLSNLAEKYYDDVDDVDAYVASLRE